MLYNAIAKKKFMSQHFEYDFKQIEPHWQQQWKNDHRYAVSNDSTKPKYYVLDMFTSAIR